MPKTPCRHDLEFGDWECARVVFLQFCCILYSKLYTMKLLAVKIYGYLTEFILKHLTLESCTGLHQLIYHSETLQ